MVSFGKLGLVPLYVSFEFLVERLSDRRDAGNVNSAASSSGPPDGGDAAAAIRARLNAAAIQKLRAKSERDRVTRRTRSNAETPLCAALSRRTSRKSVKGMTRETNGSVCPDKHRDNNQSHDFISVFSLAFVQEIDEKTAAVL